MVDVADASIFTFPETPAVDLRAIVKGPDGAPFVLDVATKTVYRIDLSKGVATAIFRNGNKAAGATQAAPKLIGVGGRDLLMVDTKNVVWRWRPPTRRARARSPGSRHGGRSGATTSRHRHASSTRMPTCTTLCRRSVGTADPALRRRRTAAAPGPPNQWLSSARRQRHHSIHRRRHLAR
jgi:hypothetical protein